MRAMIHIMVCVQYVYLSNALVLGTISRLEGAHSLTLD